MQCFEADIPLFFSIDDYECQPSKEIVVDDCFRQAGSYHDQKCLNTTKNDTQWAGSPFVEEFTYTVEPSCSDYDERYLIVYIYTQVYHFKQRQKLRLKYKDHLKEKLCSLVKILFVIGETDKSAKNQCYSRYEDILNIETNLYKDILRINIIDSYYNLAYKGLGAIHWISKKCKLKTPFVLKMDDDIDLNLNKLLNTMQTMDCRYRNYEICLVINPKNINGVVRVFWHKFNTKLSEYKDKEYPSTCVGHAVLMTRLAAENMYTIAKNNSLPVYKVDDVYFGAFLRRRSCLRLGLLSETESNYAIVDDDYKEW